MKLFSGILLTPLLALCLTSFTANAAVKVQVMKTMSGAHVALSNKAMVQMVNTHLNLSDYRQAKTQLITTQDAQPDYILVYLSSQKYHKLSYARLNLDSNMKVSSVVHDYHLQASDYQAMKKPTSPAAQCPDQSIEFIAFAPNDMDLEQQITIDVAEAAEKAGLKTVRLLKDDATRENYLNYMSCPKLKGNFYDGDANPYEFHHR